MLVGYEEEVRPNALCDSHGAGNGTDGGTDSGKEADFEAIDSFIEVVNLVFLGGLGVVLFSGCWVGFGVDLGGLEILGHSEELCSGEGSVCEVMN